MSFRSFIATLGDWAVAANWSPIGVPTLTDDVVFGATSLAVGVETVTGIGTAHTLFMMPGTLNIDATVSTLGDISDAGGVISIGGAGNIQAAGTLLLLTFSTASQLVVQGTLHDSAGVLGGGEGPASAVLSGAGALWATDGTLVFGFPVSSIAVGAGSTLQASVIRMSDGSGIRVTEGGVVNGTIDLDGVILAAASAGATLGGSVVIGGPVVLSATGASGTLASGAGVTLIAAGPISGPAATSLTIRGTVDLGSSSSTYAGTTNVTSVAGPSGASEAILLARGSAGGGPIALVGPSSSVAVQTGASGNADGLTRVSAGSGSDTISTTDTGVIAYGGTGALTVYNGSAVSTVYGGAGPTTLFGGTGGGVFFGGTGGGNVIVAGSAPVTIGGGGSGDQLYAGATGGAVIAASSGNATLSAAGSTGNNVLFGGTGPNTISTGQGTDVVIAGSGAATVFGGGGTSVIFAGTGTDQIVNGGGTDFVQLGHGGAAIFAGSGANLFAAYNGAAGGLAFITGFKPGTDHIALRSYTSDPSIATAGGNTTVTLSDNTRMVFVGTAQLTRDAFVCRDPGVDLSG